MTVKELLNRERLSMGRPCKLLHSHRLPADGLIIVYETVIKRADVGRDLHTIRWAISSPESSAGGILKSEWV